LNSASPYLSSHKTEELLAVIQSDFPIVKKPFNVIAERLGLTERQVIDCILIHIDDGIIRTFGPVFDARKLGYVSTLVAVTVDEDRVTELSAVMLDIQEITHNYLRDNDLNLWFTITAGNVDKSDTIIKWVKKFPGVREVINLPIKKVLKINAVLGTGEAKPKIIDNETEVPPPEESEKKLIRVFQNQFPIVEHPFKLLADTTGTDETVIMETINRWVNNGIIRRFGARLNHNKIGYTYNTLAAWSGKKTELWGKKFAGFAQVSHCYLRESYDRWPYELYTMIHARTESEADEILTTMKKTASGSKMVSMKTLYELKKTSMKYFMED